MRKTMKTGDFSGQAIAGTHVVLFGLNLPQAACPGLLGFAFRRHDLSEGETHWMPGYKTFASVVPSPAAGVKYPTRAHPIQDFSWSDFSAKPGHEYIYEIIAMRGKPAKPEEAEKIELQVKTEQAASVESPHRVYFNRGAAASQEFTRRFGDLSPKEVGDEAFRWLSRGAAEAIAGFIQEAKGDEWGLRVMAYEFTEEHVLAALKEAKSKRKVDVQILFHGRAGSEKEGSIKAIHAFGLGAVCRPRTAKGLALSHSKVIILLLRGQPQAVLLGSTNFSTGGIYGHSNVVHICEQSVVAEKYYSVWQEMEKNNPIREYAQTLVDVNPLPSLTGGAGLTPVFSPRKGLETLDWLADRAKTATQALFMTFAFGMHPLFQDAYRIGAARLRYALMESMTGPTKTEKERKAKEAIILALRKQKENKFAVGGYLTKGAFDRWLKESLSGLNKNVRYLHTKYMLVDPLGDHPLVITGSANFSESSIIRNDENMLIIQDDARVADIYLGEFMRLYRHFAFRDWMSACPDPQKARISRLDEKDKWWSYAFGDTFKSRQRQFFASVHTDE